MSAITNETIFKNLMSSRNSLIFAGDYKLEARKCFFELMEDLKKRYNMTSGKEDRFILYTRNKELFDKVSSLQRDIIITSRNDEDILTAIFEDTDTVSLRSWIFDDMRIKNKNIILYNPLSDLEDFRKYFSSRMDILLKAASWKEAGSKEHLWIIIDDIMSLNELSAVNKISKECKYRNIHLIIYCNNIEDIGAIKASE